MTVTMLHYTPQNNASQFMGNKSNQFKRKYKTPSKHACGGNTK